MGDARSLPDTPNDEALDEKETSRWYRTRPGVSKRTAERALERSRVFSDEDRETFEQRTTCLRDIVQRLDPEEATPGTFQAARNEKLRM